MTEHEERKRRQLDARSLRGLAHPLRMQLLEALRQRGPATASLLAERFGESSGSTSYHLRQLAAHGFVEDAPQQGKGRERWWQAVDQGLVLDTTDFDDADPGTRGVAEAFLHEMANMHAHELSSWLVTRGDWSKEWSDGSDMSDATLRLTPALSAELIAKMHELIDNYRQLGRETDGRDAETVRIHTHLFPIRTD